MPTQITLGIHRLGGDDLNLAGFPFQMMIFQCVFARDFSHEDSFANG